jgi:hypothetical protein
MVTGRADAELGVNPFPHHPPESSDHYPSASIATARTKTAAGFLTVHGLSVVITTKLLSHLALAQLLGNG